MDGASFKEARCGSTAGNTLETLGCLIGEDYWPWLYSGKGQEYLMGRRVSVSGTVVFC